MTTSSTSALRRVFRLPHGPEARYAALDGYRGLAAVLVVVYHVGANQWTLIQNTVGAKLVYGFGNMGVTLFFVLSGFLLFRPFAEKHLADRPAPGLRRYTVNRLLRIVPAFWVTLTLTLLLVPKTRLSLTGESLDSVAFVKLYLFAQNYDPFIGYSGLAVAWTLGIELLFYIVLPLIAFAIRFVAGRLTSTARGRLAVNLAALALLYGGAWLFRSMVVRLNRDMTDTHNLWLLNYLDWFALGMLLALLVAWRDTGGRIPRFLEVPAASTTLMWVAGVSLYVLYAAQLHNDYSVPETTPQIYSRFFWPGLAAFAILLPATVGNNRTDPLHRLFRTRVLLFAGTISYGLYLWHLPVIEMFKEGTWWPAQAAAYAFTMPFLVVLAISTALAAISWFALEEPVLRLKKRLDGSGGKAATTDAGAEATPWFDRPPADPFAAADAEYDAQAADEPTHALDRVGHGSREEAYGTADTRAYAAAHDGYAYDDGYADDQRHAYDERYLVEDGYAYAYDERDMADVGYGYDDEPAVYDDGVEYAGSRAYDGQGYDGQGYEGGGYESGGAYAGPATTYPTVPAIAAPGVDAARPTTSGFDYAAPAAPPDGPAGRRPRRRR